MNQSRKKKIILIIEDDSTSRQGLVSIFDRYADSLEVLEAADAGQALEQIYAIRGRSLPDAIVLDLFLPYGNAPELWKEGAVQDERQTGFVLMEYITKVERHNGGITRSPLVRVALVTAADPRGLDHKFNEIVGRRGRIYLKPYNTFELEHDLVSNLGVKSQVPEVFLRRPIEGI